MHCYHSEYNLCQVSELFRKPRIRMSIGCVHMSINNQVSAYTIIVSFTMFVVSGRCGDDEADMGHVRRVDLVVNINIGWGDSVRCQRIIITQADGADECPEYHPGLKNN